MNFLLPTRAASCPQSTAVSKQLRLKTSSSRPRRVSPARFTTCEKGTPSLSSAKILFTLAAVRRCPLTLFRQIRLDEFDARLLVEPLGQLLAHE